MKIYTKTGDSGETSLFGGTRVKKYNLRIESYGTLDELNSYIGLIKDQKVEEEDKHTLLKIQNDLFIIGAMLATPKEKELKKNGEKRLSIYTIDEDCVAFLENRIDEIDKTLPQMTHFILPGGHQTVSFCHIARCVCRRAERYAVALSEEEEIDNKIIKYLNRLSDLLFIMARKLTKSNGIEEIKWIPRKN